LDRAGGSVFGGSAVPGIRIRGVFAAGGDRDAGVPLAAQPGDRLAGGNDCGLCAAADVAAVVTVAVALPFGEGGAAGGRVDGHVDVARIAERIQRVGREPGGDCAAGGGGVFDDDFFVQRGACVGQRREGAHRAHGKVGDFAA